MLLTSIHPKLPMINKEITLEFYSNFLGFTLFGDDDYMYYLMIQRDQIQIHFFLFKDLNPKENYGQLYIRTKAIGELYHELLLKKTPIHPNGYLEVKPWGQKEFSVLDPNSNLITFGQALP